MTNGHHINEVFEGKNLPTDPVQMAFEVLISLAEEIQNCHLDTAAYDSAQDALAILRAQVERAPQTIQQHLASAAVALEPSVVDTLSRVIEGAKPIRVAAWGRTKPGARKWLVEDWLPAGRVAMLTGEGGAGKSRLALQFAAGVASGGGDEGTWLKAPPGVLRLGSAVPPEGVPVVFASWEDEPDEFYRRLHQISGTEAPWVSPERLKNLLIANMMGEGPVWAPSPGGHISSMAGLTATGSRLRLLCERAGARLLILDPLAAAYASQENTRGLVRAFVSHWDDWGQEHDCTILLLAHPPKSTGFSYAGSTDWLGAVRALWSLQRKEKSGQEANPSSATWKLESVKGNYRGPAETVQLSWDLSADHIRWQVAADYAMQSAQGAYDYDS